MRGRSGCCHRRRRIGGWWRGLLLTSGYDNQSHKQSRNQNATTYKTAFAAQWDPIAAQYGLTRYQQNQL